MNVARTLVQGIPLSHIALALAILMLVLVIPALYNPRKFREGGLEFLADNTYIRLGGAFSLLVAFIILNTKFTIMPFSNRSIMAIIGYIWLVKGILFVWYPDWIKKLAKPFFRKETNIYIFGLVGLLIAIGFCYLGLKVY